MHVQDDWETPEEGAEKANEKGGHCGGRLREHEGRRFENAAEQVEELTELKERLERPAQRSWEQVQARGPADVQTVSW